MQNYWPLLWRDQWAHADALAALTEEILSPCKIISHFCKEIDGPTQVVQQDSPKTLWADKKLLLLHWAHLGLFSSLFSALCGPIQDYQQHYSLLAVGLSNIIDISTSCQKHVWKGP